MAEEMIPHAEALLVAKRLDKIERCLLDIMMELKIHPSGRSLSKLHPVALPKRDLSPTRGKRKTFEQRQKLANFLLLGLRVGEALTEAGWSKTQSEKGWDAIPDSVKYSPQILKMRGSEWTQRKGIKRAKESLKQVQEFLAKQEAAPSPTVE